MNKNDKSMKLSSIALEKIGAMKSFKNLLAAEMGVSEASARRWIEKNDTRLTTETCLRLIERETGLSRKRILTS